MDTRTPITAIVSLQLSTSCLDIFIAEDGHTTLLIIQMCLTFVMLNLCHMHFVTFRSIEMALHYDDVLMIAMASQITSHTIVNSTVYSGIDERKQSSASLVFVRGIHRWPLNSPHKGPVTLKMFYLITSSWVFESWRGEYKGLYHPAESILW